MDFSYRPIASLNTNDPFFESLKSDYKEFNEWIIKKAINGEMAYVSIDDYSLIDGFLYLKNENGPLLDVNPQLPPANRLKVGTFKIEPRGTRLGERFIKKALDHAIYEGVEEVYVTIFPKHEYLISLLMRYGFIHRADKTTHNGTELVYVKVMRSFTNDPCFDYPCINIKSRKFLMSIRPDWHSRLLPDSILNNENPAEIVKDISHTNSIHKVYLTNMRDAELLRRGDTIVIYRTNDGKGHAHYRSVATSLCCVEEVRSIHEFSSLNEFMDYTSSYSIFERDELLYFYKSKKYHIIIKFTYNASLIKRVTRGYMIENLGMASNRYWGFFQLNDNEFNGIVEKGGIHEGLIVN